jgi:hypothetical protein
MRSTTHARTEAGGSVDAAWSGFTVELPMGELDLRAGVLHGLGAGLGVQA